MARDKIVRRREGTPPYEANVTIAAQGAAPTLAADGGKCTI